MFRHTVRLLIAAGALCALSADAIASDPIPAWGKPLILKKLRTNSQSRHYSWTTSSINGSATRLPELMYLPVGARKDWAVTFIASPRFNAPHGLMTSCVGKCTLTQRGQQKTISGFRITGWAH